MDELERRKRARKRLDQIKDFYRHLLVYLVVNTLIIGYFLHEANAQGQPLLTLDTFELALFWGFGLGVHAFTVFGLNMLTGRKWEEKQIRKYMEEDRREADKYK